MMWRVCILAAVVFMLPALSVAGPRSNGASLNGATFERPARWSLPTYLCAVGDVQVGSNCSQWGNADSVPDAEGTACSTAMATDALWVIQAMDAAYPCDRILWLGDTTDDNYGWQRRILRDNVWYGLTAEQQAESVVIIGNHESGQACGSIPAALNDWMLLSEDTVQQRWPMTQYERLPHVSLTGYTDQIMGGQFSPTCFEIATNKCFGPPTVPVSGVGVDGAACTTHTGATGCESGTCGIWQDQYFTVMDAILDGQRKAAYNNDPVVAFFAHRYFCAGASDASCTGQPAFDAVYDILECDDHPGDFCFTAASCPSGLCTTPAPGYDSKTQMLDMLASMPASQVWLQFNGHVGGAASDTVPATILGKEYLAVQIPGPFARGHAAVHQHGAVVRIDPTASPVAEVVAEYKAPNTAPVLAAIPTTINLADGDDDYEFSGTDVDYGNLNYYLNAGTLPGCMSITQDITAWFDVHALLDANSCAPGTSASGLQICVTDGDITGPPYETPETNGLSDCSGLFTVNVPL